VTSRALPTSIRLRVAGLAALVGGAIQIVAIVVRLLDLAFPNLFEGSGATVLTVLSLGSLLTLGGVLLVGLG
jgi:hypothetical protein